MELLSVPTDAELLTLAGKMADAVQRCGSMLVTAEAWSGGWIAEALTDLRGSATRFDAVWLDCFRPLCAPLLGKPLVFTACAGYIP